MKARVKATGEIVDVELSHYIDDVAWYITKRLASYSENELEFIDVPDDYWTRLEHQYAGMAMQGLLSNEKIMCYAQSTKGWDDFISNNALVFAHALVEKLKEKEERK